MPAVRSLPTPVRLAVALALIGAVASLVSLAVQPVRAAEHSVQISNFAFSPATLTIAVGDTVTWTNADQEAHTATAADGTFDSGSLGNGASVSFTFTEAGTFPYTCEFHRQMQGTIVVEAASPPAPTPTPASGGPTPGGTAAPATGGDGAAAGESPAPSQPNTAMEAPASLAWLATLLIGLGLVALALRIGPPARDSARDED